VRVEGAKTPGELADLYATNVLPVISSQHDTLNLVALEALFAGCPAVISSGAGAARYLRERFPAVPFVPFHLERFYANPPAVEDALRRYDDHRQGVADALGGVDFTPSTPPLTAVYDAPPRFDPAARAEAERVERRLGEQLTGV
jgi:hypothetical protein